MVPAGENACAYCCIGVRTVGEQEGIACSSGAKYFSLACCVMAR